MNWRHLLFLLLVMTLIFFKANGNFNKDSIMSKAKGFTNCLANYGVCKGQMLYSKEDSIYNFFKPANFNEDDTSFYAQATKIPNDLCTDDIKNCRLDYYLFQINQNYHNNIKMIFSDFSLVGEIEDNIVLVAIKKRIECPNVQKNVSILLGFDVSTSFYYIRFISLLSEFDKNKLAYLGSATSSQTSIENPSSPKGIDIKVKNGISNDPLSIRNDRELAYYRGRADATFNSGRYRKAKKEYYKLLEYQPNSAYAKSMINQCETARPFGLLPPYLSITNGFPHLLEPGKKYESSVVISYKYIAAFEATLEINLPEGCTIVSKISEIRDTKFDESNGKIKFSWDALPLQSPFIIYYTVQVSKKNNRPILGKLTGNFTYKESNGDFVSKEFYNYF